MNVLYPIPHPVFIVKLLGQIIPNADLPAGLIHREIPPGAIRAALVVQGVGDHVEGGGAVAVDRGHGADHLAHGGVVSDLERYINVVPIRTGTIGFMSGEKNKHNSDALA